MRLPEGNFFSLTKSHQYICNFFLRCSKIEVIHVEKFSLPPIIHVDSTIFIYWGDQPCSVCPSCALIYDIVGINYRLLNQSSTRIWSFWTKMQVFQTIKFNLYSWKKNTSIFLKSFIIRILNSFCFIINLKSFMTNYVIKKRWCMAFQCGVVIFRTPTENFFLSLHSIQFGSSWGCFVFCFLVDICMSSSVKLFKYLLFCYSKGLTD